MQVLPSRLKELFGVYSTHYNQTIFTLQNQNTTNRLEWTRDTKKLQEAHTTK